MKLVTGGAGFIGSHVVDGLVARGDRVRVLDNLSTGDRSFIAEHLKAKRVELVRGDVRKPADDRRALRGVDEVWHLAADPDVRGGAARPSRAFRADAIATVELLEAMRKGDARSIVFSSSSTVYGEAETMPTPESYGPCLPISAYGASKLAAEAIIAAYCGAYGFRAWMFRFGNVVGPRLTHGVIYDFHQALAREPSRLTILGDGRQEKSYLSTADCVGGMIHGREHATAAVNVLNLATHEATDVRRIAEVVVEEHGLKQVRFEFTGGDRGWAGDVRKMRLSIAAMERLGWTPKASSEDAVRAAARWIAQRPSARIK